jgi:hypothetical protein
MGAILTVTWKFFSDLVAGYEATAVLGDGDDAYDADSDGDEVNLESLMSQVTHNARSVRDGFPGFLLGLTYPVHSCPLWQVTEYLLTVLSSAKFRAMVQPSVPEMLYLLARCMQMTHSQVGGFV